MKKSLNLFATLFLVAIFFSCQKDNASLELDPMDPSIPRQNLKIELGFSNSNTKADIGQTNRPPQVWGDKLALLFFTFPSSSANSGDDSKPFIVREVDIKPDGTIDALTNIPTSAKSVKAIMNYTTVDNADQTGIVGIANADLLLGATLKSHIFSLQTDTDIAGLLPNGKIRYDAPIEIYTSLAMDINFAANQTGSVSVDLARNISLLRLKIVDASVGNDLNLVDAGNAMIIRRVNSSTEALVGTPYVIATTDLDAGIVKTGAFLTLEKGTDYIGDDNILTTSEAGDGKHAWVDMNILPTTYEQRLNVLLKVKAANIIGDIAAGAYVYLQGNLVVGVDRNNILVATLTYTGGGSVEPPVPEETTTLTVTTSLVDWAGVTETGSVIQ